MDSETIIKVIDRLIGEVNPIGESNIDEQRFENLTTLCEVIDNYVGKIKDIAEENQCREEFSMKKAGRFAREFYFEMTGV